MLVLVLCTRSARCARRYHNFKWRKRHVLAKLFKEGVLERIRPDVKRRQQSDVIDVFIAKNFARA
jgi:hypothetical protein